MSQNHLIVLVLGHSPGSGGVLDSGKTSGLLVVEELWFVLLQFIQVFGPSPQHFSQVQV